MKPKPSRVSGYQPAGHILSMGMCEHPKNLQNGWLSFWFPLPTPERAILQNSGTAGDLGAAEIGAAPCRVFFWTQVPSRICGFPLEPRVLSECVVSF